MIVRARFCRKSPSNSKLFIFPKDKTEQGHITLKDTMPINKELIADFAIDFYTAESFDEAFDIYFQLVLELGFDGVLYSFIPHISTASIFSIPPIFKSSETYSQDYLTYYGENQVDKLDPIFKLIKNGETNIIDWWEAAEERNFSDKEKEILRIARDNFGIINGITIPTLSEQRGIAGASIITSKTNKEYAKLKSKSIQTLALCTGMFHDFTLSRPLSSNSFVLPFFPDLTKKEIQVLRFQLTGKPMKQIEDSTGITTKYAEKLLANIRKKFGNISKNELIHQTSAFNILNDSNH